MGFYYGSGEPPDEGKPGGFRETVMITWVVLTIMAKPLGILFGGIALLVVLLWLFTIHPAVGLTGLAAPIVAIAAWGFWEWRHPPQPPG